METRTEGRDTANGVRQENSHLILQELHRQENNSIKGKKNKAKELTVIKYPKFVPVTDEQNERYVHLKTRKVLLTRLFDKNTLSVMGIYDSFQEKGP